MIAVAVAGGAGGVLRFCVDRWVTRRLRARVQLGTAVVNATACLAMGVLVGLLAELPDAASWQLVLGTGFLGGYSTFSTASVESARLWLAGERRAALLLAGGMLVVSLLSLVVGMAVGLWVGLALA